jgi:outer membrane receptor protein involved in Fe transport
VFPKPRGVLTWTPDPSWQIRARIEREVGQLDFDQFTASANLSTGVVNAGNANLEPERRWVLETAFERRFWGRGALIVTLSHVALQKVIDVIPVAGLSAVGNIGDGRRDTAEVALTAPLARLGMPGGLLKAEGLWLSSRVTDPTTGRARTITGDRPFTGSLALTNDVPVLRSSWSASLANGYRYRDYRINAVLAYRFASQLDLAWEYKPGLGVTVLAEAVNVTSRARTRSRTTYAGLRSVAPVSLSEQFAVRFPAYLHLRVRKAW